MAEESYLITCPACGTANRIPATREGVKGRCGSCKAFLPLLYLHAQTLDELSFDRRIDAYQGPVMAEFWAPW